MLGLALLMLTPAEAGSGRFAAGISGASGIAPIEPVWSRAEPYSAAVGCMGVAGFWITGGHDFAGKEGQVLRTPDTVRWGGTAQVCPTGSGALSGGLGLTYGRQWGGSLYVTTHATAGLSGYLKDGPGPAGYAAVAPYLKPVLAVGLAVPPGLSVEVGPYAYIAPPLLQVMLDGPVAGGAFVGHLGLEISLWAGVAAPVVAWR